MVIQPAFQAHDLALAETGRTGNSAREFAIPLLRFGSDEMVYAERPCNRARHETVGCRNDDAQIAAKHMPIDELARLRRDQGQNSFFHEIPVPGIQLAARVMRQGLQLKINELLDIQSAGLVLLIEFDITGLMDFAVEHPLLDQVLSPLEVAIACEQGIIEVKQSKVHEAG